MFVMNCTVRMEQTLAYEASSSTQSKKKQSKSRRRQRKQQHSGAEVTADGSQSANDTLSQGTAVVAEAAPPCNAAVYHPVVCSVCNSEVAVYDADEVYHFFNVLASYA